MRTSAHIIDSYWGLLNNLTPKLKLELIEKLSHSIRNTPKSDNRTFAKAYGSWISDESADEIIVNLRNDRIFNRTIEEL